MINLIRDVAKLTAEEAKATALIAPDYEVDTNLLLYNCPRSDMESDGRMELVRLVMPEFLYQIILHHYNTRLDDGHQGIGRTYQRSDQASIEEDYTGVYSGMWEYAWIAKPERDVRGLV